MLFSPRGRRVRGARRATRARCACRRKAKARAMRMLKVMGLGGLVLATAMAAACSAASTLDDEGDTSSGQGASGAGDAGTGVGGFVGSGGAGSGGSDACAADTFPGQLVPLDIHIMLDRSSSMQDSGKWTNVLAALNTFLSDAGSAGIGVGLKFFPVPPSAPPPSPCDPTNDMCGEYGPCIPQFNFCLGGTSGDSCDPTDYANPVLPIAELPAAQ